MKKNNNNIDLAVYFQTQVEMENLKKEQAKKQKRLWLRAKIHEITGISEESDSEEVAIFEEIFNWIYQAPLYDWDGMLYCFKHEAEVKLSFLGYNKALFEAKKLYSFLK